MITKRNLKYFRHAKSMTEHSDFNKIHLGCVMVFKNSIIASGCNTYKTHPLQQKYNNYRCFNCEGGGEAYLHAKHAEIDCLLSVKRENIDWSKVEVYVYRSMKMRPFGMARPCKACMKALQDKGIQHIYYTTDIGFAYENISKEITNELELLDTAI